jgi:hypothetical protein
MLMTSSTPRMRYRIGTRAWLDVLEDKSLPSLDADTDGEVAAAFYPLNFIGDSCGHPEKRPTAGLRKYCVT